MTDLLTRIESAEAGSREISDEVLLAPCPFCKAQIDPPFQNLMDDEYDEIVTVYTIVHECSVTNTIWVIGATPDECRDKWNLCALPAAGGEEEVFDALKENSWDLRCFNIPTGGDDHEIGWRVVGHWMAEPRERVVAEVYTDDPAAAVRAALTTGTGERAETPPATQTCPQCDGSGYWVDAEPGCCGNLSSGGECRGDCAIPVPVQVPCAMCGGGGLVKVSPPPIWAGMDPALAGIDEGGNTDA